VFPTPLVVPLAKNAIITHPALRIRFAARGTTMLQSIEASLSIFLLRDTVVEFALANSEVLRASFRAQVLQFPLVILITICIVYPVPALVRCHITPLASLRLKIFASGGWFLFCCGRGRRRRRGEILVLVTGHAVHRADDTQRLIFLAPADPVVRAVFARLTVRVVIVDVHDLVAVNGFILAGPRALAARFRTDIPHPCPFIVHVSGTGFGVWSLFVGFDHFSATRNLVDAVRYTFSRHSRKGCGDQ